MTTTPPSFTHCLHLTNTGEVVCLVEAPPEQLAEGQACGMLTEPRSAWPEPPHPEAQLRYAAGALQWHDARSPATQAVHARTQRDTLLAQTDWVVTRAMERAEPVPAAWAGYRQALRDVPAQEGFPATVVWPEAPAID